MAASISSAAPSPSTAPDSWLVTIAASAGGIEALQKVLAPLPPDLPAAVVVVQHRRAQTQSYLDQILRRATTLPVTKAHDNQPTIAVVLTGAGRDAAEGVQTVKAHGGFVIAQDPRTARHGAMPRSAVETGAVDYVLPLEAIAPALTAIMRGEPVPGVAQN